MRYGECGDDRWWGWGGWCRRRKTGFRVEPRRRGDVACTDERVSYAVSRGGRLERGGTSSTPRAVVVLAESVTRHVAFGFSTGGAFFFFFLLFLNRAFEK